MGDETMVCKRYLGLDIGVNVRSIWVLMSQETFGGCLYNQVETVVCTRYLGGDIVGEYGWLYVYARRDFARGRDLWWLDLRATLGPDVELDFWWVFAYCERFGDRILQETLGEFMYIILDWRQFGVDEGTR